MNPPTILCLSFYQSVLGVNVLGHEDSIGEPCVNQSAHLVDPLRVAGEVDLHGDLVVGDLDAEEVELAVDARLGEVDQVIVLLDRS